MTGVQTCALPIYERSSVSGKAVPLVTGDGVVVAVEVTVTAVPVSVGLI